MNSIDCYSRKNNPLRASASIRSQRRTPIDGWRQPFHWAGWLGTVCVFVCGGATCAKRSSNNDLFRPPVVFEQTPTLEELSEQINHSLAIETLESNSLSISSPDLFVSLQGALKWERPHNFKLEAYPASRMFGTVLSAGSNQDLFWLQADSPSPPTLYYARHEEFARLTGPRYVLPVSPLWLREALGVVELDPGLIHEGPITRPDGKLEIRSYIPSPNGSYRRHLVLDARTAVIQQTILYDHRQRQVAVAQQTEHDHYGAVDVSLPHKVDIQLMPDQGPVMALTIEVSKYMINQGIVAPEETFVMPDPSGLRQINLEELGPTGQSPQVTQPVYTSAPRATQSSLNTFQSIQR